MGNLRINQKITQEIDLSRDLKENDLVDYLTQQ